MTPQLLLIAVCMFVVSDSNNGDSSAFVAKFNDLGSVVWDRSLLPSATIKTARWKKMYLDETGREHSHLPDW